MLEKFVKTNVGNIPLNDYLEIKATQNGFDSYKEMREEGVSIDIPKTNLGNIKLDEIVTMEENNTTTLYFTAPKEMLSKFIPTNDYPEAISMEISLEFPEDHIEARYADVCVSPTKEEDGCLVEYDWYDVELPYDEIEELIRMAETSEKQQ